MVDIEWLAGVALKVGSEEPITRTRNPERYHQKSEIGVLVAKRKGNVVTQSESRITNIKDNEQFNKKGYHYRTTNKTPGNNYAYLLVCMVCSSR